eukprot:836023-Pyramimonas_sp.AAC.1
MSPATIKSLHGSVNVLRSPQGLAPHGVTLSPCSIDCFADRRGPFAIDEAPAQAQTPHLSGE